METEQITDQVIDYDISNSKTEDLLHKIVVELRQVDNDSKKNIIKAIVGYYNLGEFKAYADTVFDNLFKLSPTQHQNIEKDNSFFTEEREFSPKEFIMKKDPQTDVERVACLAYYLTHYRNQPHFKTNDITILNTEAAQRKFANAAKAVDNAAQYGYLVPVNKGQKQLSASGELFVRKLPDRDAAKEIMKKQRKKFKKNKNPI